MNETWFSRLEKALSWRKKELTHMNLGVQRINDKPLLFTFTRAATVMCYAHWEGFVRESSYLFMDFLHEKGIGVSGLKKNFVALLNTDGNERDFREAKGFMWSGSAGNLKSENLRRIAWQLGLDYRSFAQREEAIDSLVKRRNMIAHGENTGVGEEEIRNRIDDVRELMELFDREINLSILDERYLDMTSNT